MEVMENDWKWLEGTCWYVPEESLTAPMFTSDGAHPVWMIDQTVWQITDYRDGYFWGNAAVGLQPALAGSEPGAPGAQRLLGSVTPEGNVHLTFIAAGSADDQPPTIGLGVMRQREKEWMFEMQMSNTANSATVLHWAWMAQCVPGEPAWEHLPGTDGSLPEFLAAAGIAAQS